jgi:Lon protease-like protein
MPLFPLHTVLFPGARMPLRIFEPRYLELVRDCCRDGSGFGVCAILEGEEAGAPAVPSSLGCEARVVDFTTLPGGLLGITVLGGRRFRVQQSRVRDNGLIVADVAWLEDGPRTGLAIEHELLATLLRRCLEQLGGAHADAGAADYADADWVSWRLAELLPVGVADRQALLQESDGYARLQLLLDLVAALQSE